MRPRCAGPPAAPRAWRTTASAEIRLLGSDRVLKLFHDGWPAAAARREARAAGIAHAAGVPTPAVVEVVDVDGRPGIVFERWPGDTMLDGLMASPGDWPRFADTLAELHARIHRCGGGDLPAQRERLHDAIVRATALGERARRGVLDALAGLGDGTSLCHGDFNPAQIIDPHRRPAVIDWFDAVRGCPAADVAKTLLLLRHGTVTAAPGAPDPAPLLALRHEFAERYLASYRVHSALQAAQLSAWLPIVAAARLGTRVGAAERHALLGLVEGRTPRSR